MLGGGPSVAGLVFVVPPVEVVVEQDDAPRGHAGNDAPGRSREEGHTWLFPRHLLLRKALPSQVCKVSAKGGIGVTLGVNQGTFLEA